MTTLEGVNVQKLRADFPILARTVREGRPHHEALYALPNG